MQLALVIGRDRDSKASTLKGWRLLIVQPLDSQENPDGERNWRLTILGAIRDSKVMITSDGKAVQDLVGAKILRSDGACWGWRIHERRRGDYRRSIVKQVMEQLNSTRPVGSPS
ncbi:MAG: EutN/CcmL family microcompartment protein [Planctomycetales bacterium]